MSRYPWRRVLGGLALGPLALPGGEFLFLVAALSDFHEELAVTLDPTAPRRLCSATNAWEQRHVGRWVVFDDVTYRIIGRADVASTSAGAWVELCPVHSAYWSVPDWPQLSATTARTATVLCFTWQTTTPSPIGETAPRGTYSGRPASVDVWIWEDRVGNVPPTYLLDDGEETPEGMPFGGHILEDATVDGDQETGPFPLYLWDDQVLTPIEPVLDVLTAAQVTVHLRRRQSAGYSPGA